MELLRVRNNFVAFHGDPAVKLKYLDRVRAHRLADQIVKGQYWENGKGCAVGCTLHSGNHQAYESELGVPAQFAYLQDLLFEHLPIDRARTFPERFLEAIPVGADLYPAFWKFMLYLLLDDENGLITFEKNIDALRQIAVFYERAVDGEEIPMDEYLGAANSIPQFLNTRGLMDALDLMNSRAIGTIQPGFYAVAARKYKAAADASNYWDGTNQWAVLEERDKEHFRDAVAVAWRDKLLECLSRAQVTDTPVELPHDMVTVGWAPKFRT
jgi:hypothetical protein